MEMVLSVPKITRGGAGIRVVAVSLLQLHSHEGAPLSLQLRATVALTLAGLTDGTAAAQRARPRGERGRRDGGIGRRHLRQGLAGGAELDGVSLLSAARADREVQCAHAPAPEDDISLTAPGATRFC